MVNVSVAATVLNESQDIDALVTSLMQQTLAPAEVVIVDGGSTDGTWERLLAAKNNYANLVPIRDESCNLKRSSGPIARGRNVAISAAGRQLCQRRQVRRVKPVSAGDREGQLRAVDDAHRRDGRRRERRAPRRDQSG